jgi:hypothetical protein
MLVSANLRCDKIVLESLSDTDRVESGLKYAQRVHVALILCGLPECYNLRNRDLVRVATASCSGSLCIIGTENHLYCFHIYMIIDFIP